MKERPILFSAPMVRALLDDSKTQTRRPVKGFALELLEPGNFTPEYVALPENLNCPYGYPGDRLWVRESFWGCDLPGYGDRPCVVYDDEWVGKEYQPAVARPWASKFGRIPSIHMPRDCSRILLEVISLRVERINDCSGTDCVAEGIRRVGPGWERWHPDPADTEHTGSTQDPCLSYRGLWESINGAGSWAANPWVWVVAFKRVTQ